MGRVMEDWLSGALWLNGLGGMQSCRRSEEPRKRVLHFRFITSGSTMRRDLARFNLPRELGGVFRSSGAIRPAW